MSRARCRWSLSALLVGLLSLGLMLPADAMAAGKRFALVVGVSQYPELPKGLALPSAHGEASRLALALKEEAGFDDVRLLLDSAATREGITAALKDDLGPRVGWDDMLLVYFVGHGIGGDFDDPYLLTYDTRQDELPGSAMSVKNLGQELPKLVRARSYVLVTDASHAGDLNGLALLGPTASSWPEFPGSALMVSSAAVRQAGAAGAFGPHFTDAITGGADNNDDGTVTAAELYRYLVLAVPFVTQNAQYPTSAGRYDGGLALASGVVFKDTMPPGAMGKEPPGPPIPEVFESLTLDKVKFVFHDARRPQITCRNMEAVVCDPYCYLWDVPAGSCEVSAQVGERTLSTQVFVATRGAYVCAPKDSSLACSYPMQR